MDLYQFFIVETIELFENIPKTINFFVGFGLIVFGILFNKTVVLYYRYFEYKHFATNWFPEKIKAATDSRSDNKSEGFVRSFLFPWVGEGATYYRPLLPYMMPIAFASISFILVGLYISIMDSLEHIFIGLPVLVFLLCCCYWWAMYQVKNKKW
jgi:hypothetical protein